MSRSLLNPRPLFHRHRPTHHESAATVSIHVRHLAQMFNSLDPSPFWDRDLDHEAASFIEEEFSEKRSARAWHLHVYASEGVELAADLQAALEHYYERLAASARRRLREQLKLGQLALLGGVGIFLLSMTAQRFLARAFQGDTPRMLDEGLIILAWLALWRPAESLVYEWVPLYRHRRLYERLTAIRVSVLSDAHPPSPPLMQTKTASRAPSAGSPAASAISATAAST